MWRAYAGCKDERALRTFIKRIAKGYRRDMNNTRMTRGEFKVFLKRLDTRETRIQDINAQVGNLDLQRYRAPRNEGGSGFKNHGHTAARNRW